MECGGNNTEEQKETNEVVQPQQEEGDKELNQLLTQIQGIGVRDLKQIIESSGGSASHILGSQF